CLDCFAPLAMTGHIRRHCERSEAIPACMGDCFAPLTGRGGTLSAKAGGMVWVLYRVFIK
ncbi:MAG: hypothetical protein LBJ47_06835, partial [Tannerella sp.]|nr:hypothetical protein [Tannerella sp.]